MNPILRKISLLALLLCLLGSATLLAKASEKTPAFNTSPILVSSESVVGQGYNLSIEYNTLKAAFDAINAGTHKLNILIEVKGNTQEGTSTATLNASGSGAASYLTVLIKPVGGGARTISGATTAGSALIRLNGADNVTIDGLNTGGNSLTISNTTASDIFGTSTIFLQGDATNNIITNCTVLGSCTKGGGNIFFYSGIATGNDNNTVSNCNIGPAGANLNTYGICFLGSTSTAALFNSGCTIHNNNIFDYFGAAYESAGIYFGEGETGHSITNNKLYQTATRTQTAGKSHSGIKINAQSGNGFVVTGNTIGYNSNASTGVYSFVGVDGSSFYPISVRVDTITVSKIESNTITAIDMSGQLSVYAFAGIYLDGGLTECSSNTIGSQSATGSITITTSSSSGYTLIHGILEYVSKKNSSITNNNQIGGITASGSASQQLNLAGIARLGFSGIIAPWTCNNNTIGGTVANSLNITSSNNNSYLTGISSNNAELTCSGNVVRNLTSYDGILYGIYLSSDLPSAAINTVNQNMISSLRSTALSANVIGIYVATPFLALVVSRNNIHSLIAPGITTGIQAHNGNGTYVNNMIRLGIDDVGASITNGEIVGIKETGGTNNIYFNSVYIGGTSVTGNSSTHAFLSSVATNTRNYRNNIFYNARSNGEMGTGKHYAIQVRGSSANPAGLTSNNNVLFTSGNGGVLGRFNNVDRTSLAAWKTATGQDANSLSKNPRFLMPDGTATTGDLHISATLPTPIESNGIDIPSLTIDFDGNTRSGLTPVDIGADALDATLLPLCDDVVITAASASATIVSCFGGANGSITVAGQGGASPYTFASSATSTLLTGLTAGSYTVTITDNNTCTGTTAVAITQPNMFTASLVSKTAVSCNGGSNGTATLTATGGVPPYSGLNVSGLSAGTQTLTVTDANLCTATVSVTITQSTALVATASMSSAVTCNGLSNGSTSSLVMGGTAPYTYLWSNGSMFAFASGLSAGTYSYTVTDQNGCTSTASTTVTQPMALTATAVPNAPTCATGAISGADNGSVVVTPVGGTAPYVITQPVSGLTASNYSFTVTDNKGCTTSVSTVVPQGAANTTYYKDADGDGFGIAAISITTCTGAPATFVSLSGDCNDNNNAVNPGAIELCDGLDNNCDNVIPELAAACVGPTVTPNVAVSGSNATFSWTAGCYTKYRIQYRKTTPATAGWVTKLINAPATSTIIAHPSAGTYRWGMVGGCLSSSNFSSMSSGNNYTIAAPALMISGESVDATVAANVWPNPAKSQLSVSVQPETPGTCLVRMYDSMGRVMVTKSFFAEGATTVQWPVDELVNGIYSVQIVLAGQDPITKSVFIAH